MYLKGYIQALKENSFAIPIYSDGDKYYCHDLDDYYKIKEFYQIQIPDDYFIKLYLSKKFELGSIGASVFIGTEGYLVYNKSDIIINEIINYLNDTTKVNEFIHVKSEANKLQQIHKLNSIEISYTCISNSENIIGIDSIKPSYVSDDIVRYTLDDYMKIEAELLAHKSYHIQDDIIIKYLEKLIFDKDLYFTNKEIIYSLFKKYLDENKTAFEELIFDSEISEGFTSYLKNSGKINLIPITELTIEETLKIRATERRKKLKEFNYKFINNSSRIDEMERVPAYKRLGVELDEVPGKNRKLVPLVISIETKVDKLKPETEKTNETSK
jgi:hypothetical protein